MSVRYLSLKPRLFGRGCHQPAENYETARASQSSIARPYYNNNNNNIANYYEVFVGGDDVR